MASSLLPGISVDALQQRLAFGEVAPALQNGALKAYQCFMTVISGRITTLAAEAETYPWLRKVPTHSIGLWPPTALIDDVFLSCPIDDVLLTSHFVPIDLGRRLMFLDQSYTDLVAIFPTRFQVRDDCYTLESKPLLSAGRHVVIGGPIDLVWYHWLFNWCPRILLTRMLCPDIFYAADVRFVVHPNAMRPPYRDVLMTFGLDAARFLIVDPERDYRLEQATLVSFPDQNKLFPALIKAFSDHLLEAFGIELGTRNDGIFASRQGLSPPKRRIANFDEIEPVLAALGIQTMALGPVSAADQARVFHGAAIVVGAHGSDLSNILFCRAGTPVVVIESRFSVDHNLHRGLLKLAEVLDLPYHLIVSATTDDVTIGQSLVHMVNRDYVVDPIQFEQTLRRLVHSSYGRSPQPRSNLW